MDGVLQIRTQARPKVGVSKQTRQCDWAGQEKDKIHWLSKGCQYFPGRKAGIVRGELAQETRRRDDYSMALSGPM